MRTQRLTHPHLSPKKSRCENNMYDLPDNTIARYLVNPCQDAINLRDIPLQRLVPLIRAAKKSTYNTETAVLNFYFYNHAFHLIGNRYNIYDRLPEELAQICARNQLVSNQIGSRMFYQVLMSTHGHLFGVQHGAHKAHFQDFFVQQYGQKLWDFFAKNPNSYQFDNWIKAFPDVNMGEFFFGTLATFTFCGSGAAKAWANIARLGADYVGGNMSLESLADQAFSICHNGGSILNKGHMFTVCEGIMYDLLDVQDSGQIPQWILSHLKHKAVDNQLKTDVAVMVKHFPEIAGKLDTKLIAQSKAKRDAYVQGIAKNWQVANNWKNPIHQAPKINHEAKLNKVLLGI